MKPQAQVEYRPIKDLKELPGNPRTIKKAQFEKLKKSIQDNADYFEARPIILSNRTGENIILAGNQRYKAAKAIGLDAVPTILLEGLTEKREKEIIIRDNVENGDWDWDALANDAMIQKAYNFVCDECGREQVMIGENLQFAKAEARMVGWRTTHGRVVFCSATCSVMHSVKKMAEVENDKRDKESWEAFNV